MLKASKQINNLAITIYARNMFNHVSFSLRENVTFCTLTFFINLDEYVF